MQPPEHHSWMNLTELKSQLIRKIGPDRSKQYFDYLNKFLNLKLSKVEFDKLCVRTVGRDGIPLHNQLIRSILRNACTEKVAVGSKKPLDGLYHQNGQLGLPNGDVLSTSPRKARTGGRERKFGDRKSFLGPNGKTHSEDFSNGNSPCHQELMLQSQNAESSGQKTGKGGPDRLSLHAPLGIPYYPVGTGGPLRKCPPGKSVGVSDTNCLLDTITLRARMEPIVATQGLQGVSMDSANALNIGLGAYLKGVIRSCSELNRPIRTSPNHFRPINNTIPGHHFQTQEHETRRPISLQDFRIAMELNPQQLGEDSPILLERICTHAFEE